MRGMSGDKTKTAPLKPGGWEGRPATHRTAGEARDPAGWEGKPGAWDSVSQTQGRSLLGLFGVSFSQHRELGLACFWP